MNKIPVLAQGEYLTIGNSGIEKRIIRDLVVRRDGQNSELTIRQINDEKRSDFWLRFRWDEEKLAATHEDIKRARSSPDWEPDPEDLSIELPGCEIESRFIRFYKLHHYGTFSQLKIWLHDGADRNINPIFEGTPRYAIDLFIKLIAQLHGISEREARRHHDRLSFAVSQEIHY